MADNEPKVSDSEPNKEPDVADNDSSPATEALSNKRDSRFSSKAGDSVADSSPAVLSTESVSNERDNNSSNKAGDGVADISQAVSSTESVSNERDSHSKKNATATVSVSIPVETHSSGTTHVSESTSQQQSGVHIPSPDELGPTKQVNLSSQLPSIVNNMRSSAVSVMKRTRQTLSEKFGRGTKTVDTELEARVASLRLIQKRYSDVMQLARSFNMHFNALVGCQQALATEFSDLSQKMPELQNEFAYNAETQRAMFRNGEILVGALNFFISSLNTLCSKTIEDTLTTVEQYEDARLEYDAYRADFESGQGSKSAELQQKYEQRKQKFEEVRQVLDIKLKFLDENKVKVMHQQLILFHNAIAAYFAGNQKALGDTIQQFGIKLKSPNAVTSPWLESQDKFDFNRSS